MVALQRINSSLAHNLFYPVASNLHFIFNFLLFIKMVTTRSGLVLSDNKTSNTPISLVFNNGIHFDMNIIQNVMNFLPLPDLNRFCCTSKSIRLLATVEMIVKAALIHGGTSKRSINILYPLIKNRCIYPLDSEGLWELLQTNKCSVCKSLLHRDKCNTVQQVRSGIGLNICWKCLQ